MKANVKGHREQLIEMTPDMRSSVNNRNDMSIKSKSGRTFLAENEQKNR